MSLSHSEENYLKEIFHLVEITEKRVSTNSLANSLSTKASSITDMLQKLADKNLVEYIKYKGCFLTKEGEVIAKQIIRKHRLWETFLVDKLNFGWEEVHDVAEQLEHIKSSKLIDSLDFFLDFPKFDPHGDPIPDKKGNMPFREEVINLVNVTIKRMVEIVTVKEDSQDLLQYLEHHQLTLGKKIQIIEKFPFDDSLLIKKNDQSEINISKKVAENIGVKFIK